MLEHISKITKRESAKPRIGALRFELEHVFLFFFWVESVGIEILFVSKIIVIHIIIVGERFSIEVGFFFLILLLLLKFLVKIVRHEYFCLITVRTAHGAPLFLSSPMRFASAT